MVLPAVATTLVHDRYVDSTVVVYFTGGIFFWMVSVAEVVVRPVTVVDVAVPVAGVTVTV
jgi:hypothetical protein